MVVTLRCASPLEVGLGPRRRSFSASAVKTFPSLGKVSRYVAHQALLRPELSVLQTNSVQTPLVHAQPQGCVWGQVAMYKPG